MKIVLNDIIPFPGFIAVNLFGVLFVRREFAAQVSERVVNHERIHTAQMRELLYLPFYLVYFLEWVVRLFMKGNAYRNISFEREAYNHEGDAGYLCKRMRFGMWRRR